jgi:hypothetical protein
VVQDPETRLDTEWGAVDTPRESGSSVAQDGRVERVRFVWRVARRESIMVGSTLFLWGTIETIDDGDANAETESRER